MTPPIAVTSGVRVSRLLSAEWAAELTQRLTDENRRLATEDPEAFLPDLAGSLNTLSNRLAEVGRPEQALAASAEATGRHSRALTVGASCPVLDEHDAEGGLMPLADVIRMARS